MKSALIILVVCIILELNLVHAQLRTEDKAQPKRQDEQMSKLGNAKGTEYQQVKAIEGVERQPSLLSAPAPGAARVGTVIAHDGHDQQQLNAGHKIEKIADQKLEGAGGIESRQFKLEPKTGGAQPIHDQQQQPKTAIEGRIDNYGGDYGHDQQQQKNNAEQQQLKTEQEQRRQLMTEGAQAADTKMTQPRVGVEPKSFEESKQLSQGAARPFETKLDQPKTESTASQRQFEGANEQMAGPDLFSTAARIASRVYGDDQRQNNEQQREDKFRQTQTHFIEGVHGEQQANKMGAQRFVENANADTRQQGVNNQEEMHQKQQNNRFEQDNKNLRGEQQQNTKLEHDNKNLRGEQQQNTKLEQDNKFVRAQQQDKLEQDSRAIRGEQQQNTKLEQDSESRTSRGEQQQNKLEQENKLVRAQQQNAKLEQDSRAIRGEQLQNAKLEQDSRAIRGEQQQNKLEQDNKQAARGEQQEVRQADPSLALERARARERQAKLEAETRVRTAENRARQAKLEAEARANRAILEAKVRQAEHRARIGLGGGHADAPAEQQQQQLDHPSKPEQQALEQQQKQFNNQQKFGEQQAKPQPQQAAEHNANQPFVGQQAKNQQQAVEHQQANVEILPLLINTPQMRENAAPQPLAAAAGH